MSKDFFKVLFSYILKHLIGIVCCLLFFVIFTILIFVYEIDPRPLNYGYLLCISIGVLMFVLDFIRYYIYHRKLVTLLNGLDVAHENLPKPATITDNDYQNLIQSLNDKIMENKTEADTKRADMIDYYSMWAHQIKTPLSASRLLLQSEGELDRKQLLSETFKIEQYVNMVLSYLRLESESNDLRFEPYDIDRIIKQCIKKFATIFIHKKISLNYEPVNASVITDEKWLGFIIEQLLSNALKYTRSGSITIRYDESSCILSIIDTGIGIKPEDLPRVFDKGYTGYNGRMDKKSTGIGLYLCKRTADMLNHDISIASTIGEGTCVNLNLSRNLTRM